MTTTDLSKLESLAREATPGPWHEFGLSVVSCDVPQDVDHKIYRGFNKPDYGGKFLLCESVVHEPTLAYIAAANPAAVLALIQRVRVAEGRALRIRWEDGGAFVGPFMFGRIFPTMRGTWLLCIPDEVPIEHTDITIARAALEAAVREAMGHD